MDKAELLFETHTVFFYCNLQRLFILLYFMFQVDYFPSVDKGVIQLGLGDSYFISQKDILHGRIFLFSFFKTSPTACGNKIY